MLLGASIFLLGSYMYHTTFNKYKWEQDKLFDGEDALRHINPK